MIVNKDVTTYIHSLEKDNTNLLEELREYAAREDVPIIRREMESFIRVLMDMNKPKRILEIGAAIGYSAILFAQSTEQDCTVTTIENYEERIVKARENFARSGYEERITLIADDAANVLKELEGPYDFIFLDAAKGQYIAFLPDILRLLRKGGVLLADNVLQEGELVRSRYVTPRRQRTIHDRMREFIWTVKHTDELETSVITIGDGVTLSVRK